jgi:hypothetical protein
VRRRRALRFARGRRSPRPRGVMGSARRARDGSRAPCGESPASDIRRRDCAMPAWRQACQPVAVCRRRAHRPPARSRPQPCGCVSCALHPPGRGAPGTLSARR